MKHNRGELLDKGDAMKEKVDRAVDFLERDLPGYTREEYLEAVERGSINYFESETQVPFVKFKMTFHEVFIGRASRYLYRKSYFKKCYDKWK